MNNFYHFIRFHFLLPLRTVLGRIFHQRKTLNLVVEYLLRIHKKDSTYFSFMFTVYKNHCLPDLTLFIRGPGIHSLTFVDNHI